MKKYLICALVALPLLASCSGNKKQQSADSLADSAFVIQAEEAIDSIGVPKLTADGLGPVRIGMPIDSLPQGIDNLYDRIEADDDAAAMVYSFELGDEDMFEVYSFGDNKVDMISVESPKIGVATSRGDIHIGDPMTDLISLPGVTTEFASMDDSGLWYWKYNGLWFNPDPEKCSPKLIQALGERRNPPVASLIPANLPIGFIATGLPF